MPDVTPERRKVEARRMIVLIDRYLPILGGAQNNVHLLCLRLRELGWGVTVFTRRVDRSLPKAETMGGIEVRRFAPFPVRLLSKVWCAAAFVWELIRRRREYDVVLAVPCIPMTAELPAYFAALVTRKPYLVRTTSVNFERLVTRGQPVTVLDEAIPSAVWRRVYRRAWVVVTQSRYIEQLAQDLGIRNTVTVPNPVDTERFAPATIAERQVLRKELGLPGDKVVAVYTSRYVRGKNHLALVRAAARVERGERPGRLHVVLLGATERDQASSNEREVKRYVADHGLGGFVELRDDVPNVEDYLRAADLFVFPTVYGEGMSNAQLEAMACGLPVLASRLPQVLAALPEDWPLSFDPNDEEALVSLLCRMIDGAEQRRALGAELAKRVRTRHEPGRIAREYARLLACAVEGSPPPESPPVLATGADA
ncbi:MAG: glycosyltransferase [Deferrisomatales bacterium]|nr:glycosyltransferase [Deferrisomatales bacterium]